MLKTSVKVVQGIVKGCVEKLPNGKNFLRFSGIPYAKSPTGHLRFKSPQKLLKFDKSEIDCTKEGSACFSKSEYTFDYVGSEDCLYLNVYVPEQEAKDASPKAVMVWLHGGGFTYGSSSIEWFSPEYLLMEDVVVVTLNYRLHALGFLSLPSMGISGNAGLKDQQMALEWVHENISSFNGDPKRICLFGESAGGVSAHLHVLSSKSRKFINSAICQSGVSICDWAVQRDSEHKTRTLAKLLGCKSNNDRDIYDTLMAAPVKDVFNLGNKTGTADERRRNLNFTFKPSIEPESEDAFMSKSPLELMKTEDIDIPIIFGTNGKDGMIQTKYFRKHFGLFSKDPVKLVPLSLNVEVDSPLTSELAKQIKMFYFGKQGLTDATIYEFMDLMTDLHFLIPQTICNELHAKFQRRSKQYLYEFRFDGELNLFKKLLMMDDFKGACHGDDLFYLFGQRSLDLHLAENSPANILRSKICKMWTNFAKFQDPTPTDHNPLPIEWKPTPNVDKNARNVDFDYLIIDENFEISRNLNKRRMDFWRDVYRTWNAEFVKPKL